MGAAVVGTVAAPSSAARTSISIQETLSRLNGPTLPVFKNSESFYSARASGSGISETDRRSFLSTPLPPVSVYGESSSLESSLLSKNEIDNNL